MRICIVGTAYPYKGGIASFNERMASELKNQGHDVDILTFTLQYPSFFFPGKSQISKRKKPTHLKIERGLNSINPFSWLRYGLKYRKRKYDLVITRFWLPALAPVLGSTIRLIKRASNNCVCIVDNIIPHEKRVGDKFLTKFFVKSIDHFLVMSKKVEIDMKEFAPVEKVSYAPHPIYDNYGEHLSREQALRTLNLDPSNHYILFFGFIRPYKGLDLLLKSFAIAKKKDPKLKLIVAGEYYTDSEKYITLIDDLDLKEDVFLHTEFIPNEKVRVFFCASDLLAQTYYSATQSGISQLAIHYNKPILSTDVGGLPETTIDGKTGYIVPVEENAIAVKINYFFLQEDRDKFKQGIDELKELFSWENFVKEILNNA